MDMPWIYTSWYSILMGVISTIGIYIVLIIFTRIAGLRSFSKMSSFDFAITVAFGSILGSTILFKAPSLLHASVALGSLFSIQMLVATLRGRFTVMSKLVDLEPLLLMRGTEILNDHLKEAKVTRKDLLAKLREANITQMQQVHAVVMETTGDISVLHHADPDHDLDDVLLKDVRGWDT